MIREEFAKIVLSCGGCTGRTVDKVKEFGIEKITSSVIHTNYVKGCTIVLECKFLLVLG